MERLAIELGNMLFGHSRGRFPVDRDLQDEFYERVLGPLGFDERAQRLDEAFDQGFDSALGYGLTNGTYIVRPYFWGDCTCSDCVGDLPLQEGETRSEICLIALPNFVHIPTGFEMRWYKYPLRDSYSNMELTREMLDKIAVVD